MGQKIGNVVANNYYGNNEKNNVEVLKQGIVEVNVEKNGLDANFTSAPVNSQFSISTPDSGTTITNQATGATNTSFNTDYPSNYSFRIDVDNQKVLIYNNSKEIINRYFLNTPSDTTYLKYKREIYLVDISTGKKTLITKSCTGQLSTTVCILVRCYISGRSYDISFSTTNTNSYWKDSTGARVTSAVASHGDSISTTSTTIKIGAATYTLVASAPTGETVKSTSVRVDSSSGTTTSTVTGPITVVGVITTQVNSYTVSWSKTNCNVSAYTEASSVISNGGTVPYGTRVSFHITPNTGYKYNNSTGKTIETYTATSNITKTFIASAASTTLTIQKSVNLSKVYYYQGGVWKESTSNETIVSCNYGDSILVAGEPNVGYDAEYTKSKPKSVSIDSASGVTFSIGAIIKSYTVSWSATNCTITYRYAYSSTELISNGASVPYGTVIYVKAIPNEGYTMNSYETTFTVTESSSKSYTASINQITLTIDKGTGISTVYSNYPSGSWSEVGRTLVVPYGTVVKFYATANTGYTSKYTQAKPNEVTARSSGVVYMTSNVNDYTVNWSTTNCSATLVYGASKNPMFNGISLPYGTVVYVSCTANNGYTMNSYETSFTVTGNMNKSYVATGIIGKVYISKNAGVNAVYSKVGSAANWTQVTGSYIEAATGQMFYLYGEAKTGYKMNRYSSSNPYSQIKGADDENIYLAATPNEYTVSWSSNNCSVSMTYGSSRNSLSNGQKIPYGTTVYVSCTANEGYTMPSYETSFTVTGNMNKSYSANVNYYKLTINKGSHVSKVYCSYPSNAEYTAPISIPYNTTVYAWADAETGYSPIYSSSSKRSVLIKGDMSITLTSLPNPYTVSWTNTNCSTVMTYGSSRNSLSNGGTVPYGTTVYVSCTAAEGHTMNAYDSSFVVTSNTHRQYSATINSYKITLVAGSNVSTMYYRIDNGSNQTYSGPFYVNYGSNIYAWSDAKTGYSANNKSSNPKTINSITQDSTIYLHATANDYTVSWSSNNCSTTMTYGSSRNPLSNGGKVLYGTTVYVSCVANEGYTMPSYETSFTVTGNMNKSYSANVNYYTVTLNKGAHVSTIYYNLNNTGSKTYSSPFSAAYKSSVSMWSVAESGYSSNNGSSNPVNITILDNYNKTFYATPIPYTVKWSTSNCSATLTYGSSRNQLSNGQTLPYGAVVYVSCTANEGYTMNSYSSSFTVTGNVNNSYSATINSYTYTITGYDSSHMSSVCYKIGSGSVQTAYGNTSFSANYGTSVYVYVNYKTGHGGSYNGYNNRWTSTATGSATCNLGGGHINWYSVSFGGSGGNWSGDGTSSSSLPTSLPYGSTWSVSGNGNTGRVTLTINYSTGGSRNAYWNPENWQRYESYQDGSHTRYHYVTRTKKGYISPTSGSIETSTQSFTGSSETW